MSRDWEDDFNWDDYDDYKHAWVERERLRQENSTTGWIYVGVDIRHNNIAKIGLTTGSPATRASSSQNPFFVLLCAFKVKDGVDPKMVHQIEDAIICMLSISYKRINHVNSGRPSEWFYILPSEMRRIVHDFLYEKFSYYMHCYHCSERDIGVIYSWENARLLGHATSSPYRATDLSNPPIAFECLMPPGCGADCDCW